MTNFIQICVITRHVINELHYIFEPYYMFQVIFSILKLIWHSRMRDKRFRAISTVVSFQTLSIRSWCVINIILHVSGHLIHFEADLAFQNARQTFQGYFYSCQFPNTVYKKLVCYKYHITCFRSSHPF